jgi:hypothetical protein
MAAGYTEMSTKDFAAALTACLLVVERMQAETWYGCQHSARQRADPISLGIAPRACTILSKLLLLLLLVARYTVFGKSLPS